MNVLQYFHPGNFLVIDLIAATTNAFNGVLLAERPDYYQKNHWDHHWPPAAVENVSPGMIPHVYGRSYAINADLEVPPSGVEGVIVAEGSFLGGFALYVDDGKLQHTYSFIGTKLDTLTAANPLPTGTVKVRFEFWADAHKPGTGGKTLLFVNDQQVAEGRLEHTVPFRFSAYAGMDIGKENGLPVSPTYAKKSPFPFTGTIK